ncbi:MAG: DUF4956 domain-containing protein [Deltaproteobacteria bacterium]|nr:DUF4956 domain-containing protein [Deltaproteobacteria bacterium]
MEVFETLFSSSETFQWRAILVSLLLAAVLTQCIAWVYVKTFRGLSYSRSFVQALVVAGPVSAMLMLAIGTSLARGIGIVGTLALIRFRTNVRDPLDMLFVFTAFGAGIAAGTGSFAAAIIGTFIFVTLVALLRLTGFGAIQRYDGVVRFSLPNEKDSRASLFEVLEARCSHFALITMREVKQGAAHEHAYQISLRDPAGEADFVTALCAVQGMTAVSLAMQEATVEL